jgi:small subunit ribosomal protein S9
MTAAKTDKNKYFEAVGRRKTSVARVRIIPGGKDTSFTINDAKDLKTYFPVPEYQRLAQLPFTEAGVTSGFTVTAHIKGGGISSQAQALSHGIARALIEYDRELRPKVKKAKLLKRDPRAKERRKFGLKKARKAPQWSKR